MTPIKKPWSKQTVEERVRNLLAHHEEYVEKRLDPGDQLLTEHTYKNNLALYVHVDDQRHFLRLLQSILEDPYVPKEKE
jgi:hypothetical protein